MNKSLFEDSDEEDIPVFEFNPSAGTTANLNLLEKYFENYPKLPKRILRQTQRNILIMIDFLSDLEYEDFKRKEETKIFG